MFSAKYIMWGMIMSNYLGRKDNISIIEPIGKRILCYDNVKRAFDVVMSIIGLIITFPIIVIAAALIMLESKGGWLYRQHRVGLNGQYSLFTS